MLHCSACIRTCIRTVFSRLSSTQLILTSSPPHLLASQATRCSIWLRRGYTTEAYLTRHVPGSEPAPFPHDRTHISDAKFEQDQKSKLALEVRWLKDPVKLADHTVKLLREDQFEKALDIVRLASRDVVSTVSWNHLIDYEMSKARVPNAVKLYNEVSSSLVHHFRVLKPDACRR